MTKNVLFETIHGEPVDTNTKYKLKERRYRLVEYKTGDIGWQCEYIGQLYGVEVNRSWVPCTTMPREVHEAYARFACQVAIFAKLAGESDA